MKTNTILLALYGDSANVEKVCGRWDYDFETKQVAVYTIEDGLATIHSLTPTMKTTVTLPMPFTLPVNDLGSGILERIEINCNTLQPHISICRTKKSASLKAQQPALTIPQTLIADYCSLL
ncbi:hypothetical protein WBJ53_26285 [Spirosoma sp. SC4-14]|uniref:hypothetical protein n=1 Tax=Spirosoma sp. SC4-14 TaxID=3128900 RepID=UPI0030CAB066